MKTIKLLNETIESGARSEKFTPERFVSDILSISCGHRVCAHLKYHIGAYAIFSLSRGVRTSEAACAPSPSAGVPQKGCSTT